MVSNYIELNLPVDPISDSDYLPGIGRLDIKIPVGDDLLLVIGELFSEQRGHPSKAPIVLSVVGSSM